MPPSQILRQEPGNVSLEILCQDVASKIFIHLSIDEIAKTSLVSKAVCQACRSEDLWHFKFTARWNLLPDVESWFQAFKAAYSNTHDLWMTHWNIVMPQDGDSPGRCVILKHDDSSANISEENCDNRCCPRCRYSNVPKILSSLCKSSIDEAEIETVAHALNRGKSTGARVIEASTRYSILKWILNTKHLPTIFPRSKTQRNAFSQAATFHRKIKTRQFEDNALNFMTDALFFNVCESFLEPNQREMNQVRRELYGTSSEEVMTPGGINTVANLGANLELTQHSWHIVKFSNPDYVRPITFRILVQRRDCFAVYPSEGFLDPGESCYIFLSIKLLGGLISQATEALNVQREEVDPFLANVYQHEAHLPFVPFCVRYMHCTVAPCIPPSFTSRGGTKTRPGQAAVSKYKNVISYLWDHVATETNVRTQYLSAHVNANYSYQDFCLNTLTPLNLHSFKELGHRVNDTPLVHVAPNLMYRFPRLFERLQNLNLELEVSHAGEAYRTEKSCIVCKRDWGQRTEELGRHHILQMLIFVAGAQQQRLKMKNFMFLLRFVTRVVEDDYTSTDWDKCYQLLYVLHSFLIKHKALCKGHRARQKLLIQSEITLDRLSQIVQVKRGFQDASISDGPMTWRYAGVYKYRLSTDSVFEPKAVLADLVSSKIEPAYLDGFRHLCHNPGTYCLGRQYDPNYEDEEIPIFNIKSKTALNRLLLPRKRDVVSDIFMNNIASSFASALAMIHDPRSLIVHGVYDRIFSPGIARRPSVPSSVFARANEDQRDMMVVKAKAEKLLTSLNQDTTDGKVHFPLSFTKDGERRFSFYPDDLDEDGMKITRLSEEDFRVRQRFVFEDFIRNTPLVGVGRFALCYIDEDLEQEHDQVRELEISSITQNQSSSHLEDASYTQNDQLTAETQFHREQVHPFLVGPRGPRLVAFFWLLSTQLGWNVRENQSGSLVFIDRRILISSQWFANTVMAMPVLYTLMARSMGFISTKPLEYFFDGIPYHVGNEMRFFSQLECLLAAAFVAVLWLIMGRYSERKVGRTLERSMLEHFPSQQNRTFYGAIIRSISLWIQQLWDRLCPIFLQRLVFTPYWNRRGYTELINYIRAWRMNDFREHRSHFSSDEGLGVMTFGASVKNGGPPSAVSEESSLSKIIAGVLVALGSFSACSPHFLLNLLTVFCCSIGLGMSVSLQCMETGRRLSNSTSNETPPSVFSLFGFNTIVIGFFLLGQLIGSSGGVLFLAEVLVTSVSLVLGGAGTISSSALESWGCFFCLSTAAFWGYIFARVALIDGMKQKRRGTSGGFLCSSLMATIILFTFTALWECDTPHTIMINKGIPRVFFSNGKDIASQLQ